ncbi:MAG TPA: V-type ATP synthase subunit F [Candidatus Hydrogenedentes bacterium]|jgi:V/A-type H+-transporting ATPase subunit F|nr:V-type ATP synthase subunit F [FCB group bacterium]NLT60710.1 Vacuolar H+transporting two-sector ATPase F subunit [Candidatus Hydrogenedentota bacterium]HPA03483.1 V-type ATP synthase subunit F [Candidatus Hydrogenedentota bacterium]HPV37964.1 V-type ATP synthase subunit F [Candidatus Hydrogenedentota bacterium]HPX40608.1 V-type ATP synthase subunit F [Candidatus Hydrogenedentota bacterium]
MVPFIIGDGQTVLGFRLVGVEGRVASGRDDALAALNEALDNREIGLIVIPERLAAEIRDEIDARLADAGFPLILEVADAAGPMPGRPGIEDIVRKAVGVSL